MTDKGGWTQAPGFDFQRLMADGRIGIEQRKDLYLLLEALYKSQAEDELFTTWRVLLVKRYAYGSKITQTELAKEIGCTVRKLRIVEQDMFASIRRMLPLFHIVAVAKERLELDTTKLRESVSYWRDELEHKKKLFSAARIKQRVAMHKLERERDALLAQLNEANDKIKRIETSPSQRDRLYYYLESIATGE